MTQRLGKYFTILGASAAIAFAAAPVVQARNGADDPPNHNAGDDNGGLVVQEPGADDPANHDAGDDSKTRKPRSEHRHRHHHHRGEHGHRHS